MAKPERRSLQESHDALARQMAVLLGQVVYGHHGITRLQVLIAAEDLKRACPLQAPASVVAGIVPPSVGWVEDLIEKATMTTPDWWAIRGLYPLQRSR